MICLKEFLNGLKNSITKKKIKIIIKVIKIALVIQINHKVK